MASSENTVTFTKVAEKHLAALSKEDINKVLKFAARLKANATAGASPLKHLSKGCPPLWRKKLGDLRILYTYDSRLKEVIVRAIILRREDTYDNIEKWLSEGNQNPKKERLD